MVFNVDFNKGLFYFIDQPSINGSGQCLQGTSLSHRHVPHVVRHPVAIFAFRHCTYHYQESSKCLQGAVGNSVDAWRPVGHGSCGGGGHSGVDDGYEQRRCSASSTHQRLEQVTLSMCHNISTTMHSALKDAGSTTPITTANKLHLGCL